MHTTRGRRRTIGSRLRLALVSLLVAGVSAELVVTAVRSPRRSVFSQRVPHPALGWNLQPGAAFTYATAEFSVPIRYNSKGWRDVERTYANASGAYRVVVLGDSFMEAYSVPLESAFSQVLEARLSTGRPVEVINLGVGGYGTLQAWTALTLEGLKYRPDLVLLAFYGHNDAADNSLTIQQAIADETSRSARSRPFLDPTTSQWRVVPPDVVASRNAFQHALGRGGAAPGSLLDRVKRMALYGLARDVWRGLERTTVGVTTVRDGRRLDPASDVYRCDETTDYAEAWRVTERILARLATDVRRAGARLAVFSVPSNLEIEPPRGRDGLCFDQPPSSRRLPDILAAHAIDYIDLLPHFRAAHDAGARLFWMKSDLHWTSAGHALAARVVDEGLRALGVPR